MLIHVALQIIQEYAKAAPVVFNQLLNNVQKHSCVSVFLVLVRSSPGLWRSFAFTLPDSSSVYSEG